MDDIDKYKDLLNDENSFVEDQMGQFIQKSGLAKIPEGKGKKVIWDAIESSLDAEHKPQSKSTSFNPWVMGGIAAAILLLVTLTLMLDTTLPVETIHVIADANSNLDHELPDGSVVRLNSSSSILYDEQWNRSLSLTGEAFFKVTRGSTFTVKTILGDVQVLGTSFNVFARDSIFKVACKSGKVKVIIPDKDIVEELVPGMTISSKRDTTFQVSLTPEEIGNWTTGEFYFSNRPLREVLDEVERQYSTKIDIENGDTLRFTGYFFNHADLNSTLDLICLPLGLSFAKKDDNLYVIRSQRTHKL